MNMFMLNEYIFSVPSHTYHKMLHNELLVRLFDIDNTSLPNFTSDFTNAILPPRPCSTPSPAPLAAEQHGSTPVQSRHTPT